MWEKCRSFSNSSERWYLKTNIQHNYSMLQKPGSTNEADLLYYLLTNGEILQQELQTQRKELLTVINSPDGTVQLGSARFGTEQFGTVQFGTVRYGSVRFSE